MPRDVPSERRTWLLQRRTALSERQLGLLFASLCVPTLVVAAAFLWWGYWHMLAYAALELAALGTCLRHYARHAGDYDRIDISENAVVVEQRRADRHSLHHLDLWTVRLLPPARDGDPICLNDRHDHIIALGRFASEDAATRALTELGRKGVRSARVVPERRDTPAFVLRLPQADAALRAQVLALGPALAGRDLRACD